MLLDIFYNLAGLSDNVAFHFCFAIACKHLSASLLSFCLFLLVMRILTLPCCEIKLFGISVYLLTQVINSECYYRPSTVDFKYECV